MELTVGEVLEGKVTGITKFGAFVLLPGGKSGLVHISEVANAFVTDVSEVAQQVMNVQSVNAIDQATTPTDPSGPNRKLYTAVGFLGGLFVAVVIVVAADALNTKVRNSQDAEELLGLPVVGHYPAVGR